MEGEGSEKDGFSRLARPLFSSARLGLETASANAGPLWAGRQKRVSPTHRSAVCVHFGVLGASGRVSLRAATVFVLLERVVAWGWRRGRPHQKSPRPSSPWPDVKQNTAAATPPFDSASTTLHVQNDASVNYIIVSNADL